LDNHSAEQTGRECRFWVDVNTAMTLNGSWGSRATAGTDYYRQMSGERTDNSSAKAVKLFSCGHSVARDRAPNGVCDERRHGRDIRGK
jgi:hypothetical protein